MIDKKVIILGLIVVAALVGLFWYTNQAKLNLVEQTASVTGDDNKEEASQSEATDEFFLGSPDAPVTMIEYSSHFCGHCADFHTRTLPLLITRYVQNGQLKIIPRLVSPLELGLAILCAQEEGKFMEFNGYLFEHNQEIKSIDDLKNIASRLDLNQDNFNQCFDSKRHQDKIQEWFTQANEAGVRGTPTFFINDQQISGNQPYAVFEEVIDRELAQ